jgi:predicted homoserine dehydrogenase-like protein
VIIDATGNPNVGAEVALAPSRAGKHMVMMNVEADVTIGAYLSAQAAAAGGRLHARRGDEPTRRWSWSTSSAASATRRSPRQGQEQPVSASTPPPTRRRGGDAAQHEPRMLVEFVDGSKTMVEMVGAGNATGLVPDVPACTDRARAGGSDRLFCPRDEAAASRKAWSTSPSRRESRPGVFRPSPRCVNRG